MGRGSGDMCVRVRNVGSQEVLFAEREGAGGKSVH
jgi:hypothetical protein